MFSSEAWLAKSGADFYNGQVTNSLRVNQGDSMTRAFGTSPTSSTTMSFGGWCKFTGQHYMNIFSATLGGSGVPQSFIQINSDLKILLQSWTGSANIFHYISTRVIRDTSAWMHLWVQIDTTDGTASDRVKLYVNGVRETVFDTEVNPSSGVTVVGFNQNYTHYFGHTNASYGIGAYLADWWFLDGQDVSPVDTVGEFKNGVFIPKEYSSPTFGNKGFHLEFKQSGVGTASTSTIGADTSGNANHWTSSGIVASDCNMPDSPENNFATINPLNALRNGNTLSEGNLKITPSDASYNLSTSTLANKSGLFYFEVLCLLKPSTNNNMALGFDTLPALSTTQYIEKGVWDAGGVIASGDGASFSSNVGGYTTGDILSVAYNLDTGKGWFRENGGAWVNSGDPENGSGNIFTFTSGLYYTPAFMTYNTQSGTLWVVNYGQDSSFAGNKTAQGNTDANGIGDFYYAPPSGGFLALCTANLPEPTIGANSDTQATDHFNTVIYDGTNGEKAISDVGFQPDLVWLKRRNADGHNHMWHDSSRPLYGYIRSSLTSAENTNSGYDWFKSFDTNGFTVSYSSTGGGNTSEYSTSGGTYVAWNWLANGSTTSSNTDGSVTSTVQANTTAGFSIVTWTGTGATVTLGHSLGKKPDVMIVKNRDATNSWVVYHSANTSEPATEYLLLNDTAATADNNTLWNDTEPTDSVFTVYGQGAMNGNTNKMIAYLFTEIEGYSKFGSYTANNSTDGSFVFTNFTPAFVMIKSTSQTESWDMHDNARNPFNVNDKSLIANGSNTENVVVVARQQLDFLSNGFKLRNAGDGNASINNESGTYIYMAFAKNPFKYSTAQ